MMRFAAPVNQAMVQTTTRSGLVIVAFHETLGMALAEITLGHAQMTVTLGSAILVH